MMAGKTEVMEIKDGKCVVSGDVVVGSTCSSDSSKFLKHS